MNRAPGNGRLRDEEAMNRLQESGAARRAALPAAALLAVLVLAGCTAARDMTQTPEEAAAAQPSRVAAEGASDEFPNLAEVPSGVQPQTADPERAEIMARMAEDRAQATFSDPAPLVTAAPADPFSTSVIISGDSVTTDGQVTALPAAGGGRLAAIIFFSHGSAELDPRDRAVLRDLAALHRQRGGSLRVVGHASSRTHNATPEEHRLANFEMSMGRAETVQAELRRLGVAADAVRAEAVGDAEPVYHEFMPSGEAGNRRVEIFLEN
jgi:outer membrane protein OmpA-like peptidoglycan-associated protein